MAPADPAPAASQRNLAAGVICLAPAILVSLVPLATAPTGHAQALTPAYEAALITCDLVTAALLFGQFAFFRTRAVLALASGYLFCAGIAFVHVLALPAFLYPAKLPGAGPHSAAWLYIFWHAAFPLFVCAYALLDDAVASRVVPRAHALAAAVTAVCAAAALVLVATLLATVGAPFLPAITVGDQYSASMIATIAFLWWASAAALFILWRRPQSALGLWLIVATWAWIFDVGISALLDPQSLDYGFYTGPLYGLIASSTVLVALLIENGRMHLRLAECGEELNRSRGATAEAVGAKGAFITTMSHEIRALMNGVMGMLDLLSLARLNGEQRTNVEIVRESGRSLIGIVDDILDLSTMEAGAMQLEPQSASLARIVETACNAHCSNAEAKGLALSWSIDRSLGARYNIDPRRVRQILENLIGNAIKFTRAGSVTVRADLLRRNGETDSVRLRVEDTGPGICLDDILRLYNPFVQAAAKPGSGPGLGLSICKHLAKLMGGTLELNCPPGLGTRVVVTLPMERAVLSIKLASDSGTYVGRPQENHAAGQGF